MTRFSGRPAPLHPGGIPGLPDAITREAHSHEVKQRRLLAGQRRLSARGVLLVRISLTRWASTLARSSPTARFGPMPWASGCCPTSVQRAADPDAAVLRFLESTYRAAADLARWDRSLDCATGVPAQPRQVGAG